MIYSNVVLFCGQVTNVEDFGDTGQKITINVSESFWDNEEKKSIVVKNDYFITNWSDDDLSDIEGQTVYIAAKLVYRKVKSAIAVYKNDTKKDFEYGKFDFKYDAWFEKKAEAFAYLKTNWGCEGLISKDAGDVLWSIRKRVKNSEASDE